MKQPLEPIQSTNYQDKICTLVEVDTGKILTKGMEVKTFRGETVILDGGNAPHKPNSTGCVWISDTFYGNQREYYAGVINAEWRPNNP